MLFEQLGNAVRDTWDGRAEHLPDEAAALLADADLPDLNAVLATAASLELPRQADLEARFGDPPVTFYQGPGFRIDVNLWAHSTTAIHQHSFAGAFRVLHGRSLHTVWSFEPDHPVGDVVIGTLTHRRSEVLHPGHVARIPPGSDFIHSLFHLDHPCATVVVRTAAQTRYLPQMRYDPPGVGVPSDLPERDVRRLQLAHFAAEVDHEPLLETLLARGGPALRYHILAEVLAPRLVEEGERGSIRLDAWFDVAGWPRQSRRPLHRAALQHVRRNRTAEHRALLRSPEDRLVAGALLDAPDRATVQAILGPDAQQQLLDFIGRADAAGALGSDATTLRRRIVEGPLDDPVPSLFTPWFTG